MEKNINPFALAIKTGVRKIPTRDIVLIAVMLASVIVGGKLSISITAIPGLLPMTLQTFFAAACGALLGAKRGAIVQAIYLAMGVLGLPVFASAPFGGFTYVFMPSFGFIIGFIAQAIVTGIFYPKVQNRNYFIRLSVLTACLLPAYIIGASYEMLILWLYLKRSAAVLTGAALSLPLYLLGDFITLLVLTAALPLVQKSINFKKQRSAPVEEAVFEAATGKTVDDGTMTSIEPTTEEVIEK
ncbi:MAG: biotin transporter BioY [Clostridiales bacterium]|jgi:biotin transport system substrate-specific component|nr:biotin transporter BioY [Clostridiales bacterium]